MSLILYAHSGHEFGFPTSAGVCLTIAYGFHLIYRSHGESPGKFLTWIPGSFEHSPVIKNYTLLNLLTAISGIPTSKDDIDGSRAGHVHWVDNDLPRITTHCQKDVIATAQLIGRYRAEELMEDGLYYNCMIQCSFFKKLAWT